MSEGPGCEGAGPPGALRTGGDIGLILLLVAAVVLIAAHAPSHTYSYAQFWNIGAGIAMLDSGDWLLPRNQLGHLPRKPQLYPWLVAAACRLTGTYEDFTFRLPTIAAAAATAVLVYLLGRRWYGRRSALLAGVLWVAIVHHNKAMYLATTDMLLTLWITASVFCVDRLLFHPRPGRRGGWVVALWTVTFLGALTKGWGLVNFVLVGLLVVLAGVLAPGFREARRSGAFGRLGDGVRIAWRRAVGIARSLHLAAGLGALVLGVGVLGAVMIARHGGEFLDVVRFEVVQRATGAGEDAPARSTVPSIAALVYFGLPTSVFAIVSLFMIRPRRWLAARSPLRVPLCWIIAVVLPFSLVHAYRPDYLLPCYPAVALMGAWVIRALPDLRTRAAGLASALRHVCAAPVVVISVGLVLVPPVYLLHERLPEVLRDAFPLPHAPASETWWILTALIPLGVLLFVAAVRASLRWRIERVAVLTVVGMLGVMFLYTHAISRHARLGQGEKMLAFAREVRGEVGSDPFGTWGAEKLGVDVYLGRIGRRIDSVEELHRSGVRWLITTDWGLQRLPRTRDDDAGRVGYRPEQLGSIRCETGPIRIDMPGDREYLKVRAYLIRLPPGGPAYGSLEEAGAMAPE